MKTTQKCINSEEKCGVTFYPNFFIAFQKLYKIHFLTTCYLGWEKNLRVTEQALKSFRK